MTKRLRIRINWPRLLENMARQERQAMDRSEVEQWLREAGFQHDREDWWIVKEPDLGHLEPDEVLSVEDA